MPEAPDLAEPSPATPGSFAARPDGWSWSELRGHLAGVGPRLPPRWAAAIGVLLLGVVGGLVVVAVAARPAPRPGVEAVVPPAVRVPTPSTAPPDLVVHVAGAVLTPGVYRLPPGSRVSDALERAGGATPAGEVARLNLAEPLADGTRVYVPVAGESPPSPLGPQGGGPAPAVGGGGSASGGAGAVVDLNTATPDELEQLPGVGPSTAAAIVRHREGQRFATVDDLLAVPGIGPAKLEALRDRVRV